MTRNYVTNENEHDSSNDFPITLLVSSHSMSLCIENLPEELVKPIPSENGSVQHEDDSFKTEVLSRYLLGGLCT